jgi:hypothetical protein
MSASTISATPTSISRLFIVALGAGVVAAVVNLIVYFIGAAAGAPFLVIMTPGTPPMALPAIAFVFACIIPALVGAGLYALLGRFTRRGTAIFIGIAVAFALLSLLSPLTMPVELSTRLLLALGHLITAAIITWGLVRYARQG